jgi:hypothetical protein
LLFDFDRPVALGVSLNIDVRAEREEGGAHDCGRFQQIKALWIGRRKALLRGIDVSLRG